MFTTRDFYLEFYRPDVVIAGFTAAALRACILFPVLQQAANSQQTELKIIKSEFTLIKYDLRLNPKLNGRELKPLRGTREGKHLQHSQTD